MKRLLTAVCSVLVAGCSFLDAINPFASSGPKMAELRPFVATAEARILWQESIGKSEDYVFTPAVVGTSVFAAARDGSVVRLDDGRPAWRVKVERPLSGGVGSDGRAVAVGTAKGDIYVLDAADGKLLWQAKVSSEVIAPPAVSPAIVVVRSGDHRLTAFDAVDGKRKWVYQRPGPPLSLRAVASPLVIDRFVFVGFPGGKLIAVNAENGAPLWEGTVALPRGATDLERVADVTSVPAIDGRMICSAAYQGRVSCFDLSNGNLMWSRDMSSSAGVAIDNRYVYVVEDKGVVHALDKASGASIWKQDKLFLRRLTAPLARNRLVAVGDVEGVLHFLNRDDGAFAARLTTDGSAIQAPLQPFGGDDLVVQTRSGRLLAVETR